MDCILFWLTLSATLKKPQALVILLTSPKNNLQNKISIIIAHAKPISDPHSAIRAQSPLWLPRPSHQASALLYFISYPPYSRCFGSSICPWTCHAPGVNWRHLHEALPAVPSYHRSNKSRSFQWLLFVSLLSIIAIVFLDNTLLKTTRKTPSVRVVRCENKKIQEQEFQIYK